jgi:hypothetical protein
VERPIVQSLRPLAAQEGVVLDYSQATCCAALAWFVGQVQIFRVPVPDDLPEWIRSAHQEGLTEFTEDSKSVILRGGYYLGECFARLPGMRWTTGNPDYMHCHMPVVVGFNREQQMAPLVIFRVVCRRIVGDREPLSIIDRMLDTWRSFLVAPPK